MPYASNHYPFENADHFKDGLFPADFIAEGLDQTRGWFYTLSVLGTKLFGVSPFRNCIVNGLVLAEDGKKVEWHGIAPSQVFRSAHESHPLKLQRDPPARIGCVWLT